MEKEGKIPKKKKQQHVYAVRSKNRTPPRNGAFKNTA